MKVLIDGIEVPCPNGVKVIYENVDGGNQELHIAATHEGLIFDCIEEGNVFATRAVDPSDLQDDIAAENLLS